MTLTVMAGTIDGLRGKIGAVSKQKIEIQTVLNLQKKLAGTLQGEICQLEENLELLGKTKAAFKHLLDSMVLDGVKKIEALLTYGLKTVYHDRKLSCKVEVAEKRGVMTMEILLCDEDKGVEGPVIGGFGGGPVHVISFLLRVLSLLNLKLRKVLILDESFSHVDKSYTPRVGALIASLCEKAQMDVLLVTHQEEFLEHSHNAYQVEEGSSGLKVSEIKKA